MGLLRQGEREPEPAGSADLSGGQLASGAARETAGGEPAAPGIASGQRRRSLGREASMSGGKAKGAYKLIDLGTAVGVHEDEENQAEGLMTVTELAFAG